MIIDHKWPGCFQRISAPIGKSGFWWPALKLPFIGTYSGFQINSEIHQPISVRQIFENRPEIRSISSALNIVDIPSVIFFNSRLVSSELNKPTIIFIQISRTSLLTIWLKCTAQKSTQIHLRKRSNLSLISWGMFSLCGLCFSSSVSGIGKPPRWHLQMTSLNVNDSLERGLF